MKRRGISPIIATVMTLLVAIAVGAVFLIYIQGYFGAQAQMTKVNIASKIVGHSLLVDVHNIGTTIISVESVAVSKMDGTSVSVSVSPPPSLPQSLSSGQSTTILLSGAFTEGTTYIVKVTYKDPTGALSSELQKVVAR